MPPAIADIGTANALLTLQRVAHRNVLKNAFCMCPHGSESDCHGHAAVLLLVSVSHGAPHLTEYHGLLGDGSVGVRAAHIGPLLLAKDCGRANDAVVRETSCLGFRV